MELDDLKATWRSVEPRLKSVSSAEGDIFGKKYGAKAALLRRFYCEIAMSVIIIAVIGTSRLWAPAKFPPEWIAAFCVLIAVGIAVIIRMIRLIRAIDLWEFSHAELLAALLRLKKFYKKTELWLCMLLCLFFFWLTMVPPFVGVLWRQILVVSLCVLGMTAEAIYYRSTLRKINKLNEWNGCEPEK